MHCITMKEFSVLIVYNFCFFYLYFEFCTSLGFVLGLTEMCVKLMNNVHTDFFWFLKLQVIYFLKT